MEDVKDTITNLTSFTALGAVLMDWTNIFTFLLVLTGVLLNVSRLYDWWKGNEDKRVKKYTTKK